MRIGRYAAAWFAVACCGLSTTVSGQTRTLTLTDVMTRAHERAPLIVSARLALEATRGRLLGASLRQQSNPELDARLGNRSSTSGRFTDMQISVTQAFEPGGRRSARIAGAAASIDQADATVDETVRSVLRGAAGHYYRALHAAARIHLLDDTEALAARALSVAERRFRAGDVAVLDVNIARASLGRARAERETAQAVRGRALGDLKTLLGIDDGIVLAGALVRPDDVDLPALLDSSARRPELRALEAAVREAEADVDFGRTLAKPAYGAVAQYGREEGDRVILGGLTVTLPVFSNGQELRATGATRAVRSRAELAAARARVQLEVRTAFDTYSRRLMAVQLLETEALPGLDENQTLATRSFDVGQLGLPELLVIRREIVDTRALYLDALLEAALARVDLDASAARLP